MKINSIAVTGATGHVGNVVCREAIRQGYKVHACYLNANSVVFKDVPVKEYRGDICDVDFLIHVFKKVDAVIHSAANISLTGAKEGEVERVNVQGTEAVIRAATAAQVKRLVYVGSIHAIQHNEDTPLVDETLPLALNHAIAYNRSKAQAQHRVQQQKRVNSVILNLTGVIGPHDYKMSAMGRALWQISQRTLPALVADQGFNWVDVRDVAAGILLALLNGKNRENYLLSGTFHTIQELAAIIATTQQGRTTTLAVPLWMAYGTLPFIALWSRLRGTPMPYSREALFHLAHSSRTITHQKASRELGYTTRSTEHTISEVLQWYRDNSDVLPISS